MKHEDQQKRRPSSPLGLSARLLSAVRQTFGHQQLGHSTFGQQLWDTLLLDSTSWDTALHWIWTLEAVTLFGKRHPLTDDHAELEWIKEKILVCCSSVYCLYCVVCIFVLSYCICIVCWNVMLLTVRHLSGWGGTVKMQRISVDWVDEDLYYNVM